MFAFAADGKHLPLPEGAAPLAVQARQVPRWIVTRLNRDADRGVRFFPFMGLVDGRRRFFDLDAPFEVERLRSLHGQGEVEVLVDGVISPDRIQMRVHSAAQHGPTLVEVDVEFDPCEPWPAMRRLLFELGGILRGLEVRTETPAWHGPMLGWFWIAKDELLGVEAQIHCDDPLRRLRAAREATLLAPHDPEVVATLIDTARFTVVFGAEPAPIGAALRATLGAIDPPIECLADAALVIEACEGIAATADLWLRLARARPGDREAAVRAGFALHARGDDEVARAVLRAAFDAGCKDPELCAQLAAAEEECGDYPARDALLESLVAEEHLPLPVARLVASHLIDSDRPERALQILERWTRADAQGVSLAGVWLERGRALLHLGRSHQSVLALEQCLATNPPASIRTEARRLLRLAADPTLVPHVRELELALRSDDLIAGLRIARRLVRERPTLAEAWLLLGIVRQRGGAERRAIRAFRHALALQHDLGEAHNRLGVLLLSRGHEVGGYDHLRRAVELMPHDTSPWIHFAQACHRLGKDNEAADALERAERLGGHAAEIAALRQMLIGE